MIVIYVKEDFRFKFIIIVIIIIILFYNHLEIQISFFEHVDPAAKKKKIHNLGVWMIDPQYSEVTSVKVVIIMPV